MTLPPLLVVPGLRDDVAQHWQTLLAASDPAIRSVPPMGREDLDGTRRIHALARDWGSELVDLGAVGHLNPASGYGESPQALHLIARLSAAH